MYFLMTNNSSITQPIKLKLSPFERLNLNLDIDFNLQPYINRNIYNNEQ